MVDSQSASPLTAGRQGTVKGDPTGSGQLPAVMTPLWCRRSALFSDRDSCNMRPTQSLPSNHTLARLLLWKDRRASRRWRLGRCRTCRTPWRWWATQSAATPSASPPVGLHSVFEALKAREEEALKAREGDALSMTSIEAKCLSQYWRGHHQRRSTEDTIRLWN